MKLQSLSSPLPSSTEHTFTECPPSASWAGASARSSQPRLASLQAYAGDGRGRDVPLQERQHRNRPRNSKLSATHGLTAAEKSIPKLFWFLSNPLTHSLPNLTLKRHRSVFFPLSLMKGLKCSLGVWGLWDDGKHLREIKSGLRIWGLLAELGLSLLHPWKQLLTTCLQLHRNTHGSILEAQSHEPWSLCIDAFCECLVLREEKERAVEVAAGPGGVRPWWHVCR